MLGFSRQDLDVVKVLTENHLKIKYKRTSLGFLWSLLNPLLSVGVISLVFSTVMGMAYSDFVIMFFPAFLAWNLFSNSVNGATVSIINNENLIKKTPINIMIFPMVNVAIHFVEFMLTFGAFIVIAAVIGYEFTYTLMYVPLSIVLLLLLTYGVSLLISVVATYYRDVAYLVGVLMQMWFYLSPVLYPKDFITGKVAIVDVMMQYNPMVYFIALFRDPITYHRALSADLLLVVGVASLVAVVVGRVVFSRYRYDMVHRL